MIKKMVIRFRFCIASYFNHDIQKYNFSQPTINQYLLLWNFNGLNKQNHPL